MAMEYPLVVSAGQRYRACAPDVPALERNSTADRMKAATKKIVRPSTSALALFDRHHRNQHAAGDVAPQRNRDDSAELAQLQEAEREQEDAEIARVKLDLRGDHLPLPVGGRHWQAGLKRMNHGHDVMVLDRIEQHCQHQTGQRDTEQARVQEAAQPDGEDDEECPVENHEEIVETEIEPKTDGPNGVATNAPQASIERAL
jgi:hypothetical protein